MGIKEAVLEEDTNRPLVEVHILIVDCSRRGTPSVGHLCGARIGGSAALTCILCSELKVR